MENIDNMAKNSLESLAKSNLSDKTRKRLTFEIISGAMTLCLLAAGLILSSVKKSGGDTVSQLLYFIGFLIEGLPVIIKGICGVFSRRIKNVMEILVAIAIIACAFSGQLILALLIPLILNIVHLLEERSIMGGRDVIEGLKKMQQSHAVLLENGEERLVDARTLKVGQTIIVKPGAGIPIDGAVIDGRTHIDQKSLTGEPQPAYACVGDKVYAGTVNLEGKILVKVEKEFVDTSFSKILNLLEKSENISVPESRLMDKFLSYYIPFVLGIAAVVAIISRDISKFVAVLVVSCPCGQMLVSSAPMIASLSVATKRGVLIKNSKFVEDLARTDTIVFDKTGTITKGELSFVDAVSFPGFLDKSMLSVAASLAAFSDHPVSVALTRYATESGIKTGEVKDYTEHAGCGVEGILSDAASFFEAYGDAESDKKNRKGIIRFGNSDWLTGCGCKFPEGVTGDAADQIGIKSYVSLDDSVIGYVIFNDTVREDAKDSIDDLRKVGVRRIVMLTGDNHRSAEQICNIVGADEVYAKLMPQDKSEKIGEWTKAGEAVVAVGDGVNDALALKSANVGIAMGAMGSDLAIDSADIALMNNNLGNIPFVIKLSKKTKRIIYQNMTLSILISLFMITISAFGFITPLMGAILHNIGAFSVLINSSRLISFHGDKAEEKGSDALGENIAEL